MAIIHPHISHSHQVSVHHNLTIGNPLTQSYPHMTCSLPHSPTISSLSRPHWATPMLCPSGAAPRRPSGRSWFHRQNLRRQSQFKQSKPRCRQIADTAAFFPRPGGKGYDIFRPLIGHEHHCQMQSEQGTWRHVLSVCG